MLSNSQDWDFRPALSADGTQIAYVSQVGRLPWFTCYVVSPWVKRHTVNSTMYNQASVLRTMEIILGLHPMTTYDAGARPMFGVFADAAAPGTYTLEKPRVSLTERNPAKSPTAARSKRMDFRDADDIDDDELNAILWAAIKGPDVPMPAPVRSRFAR